MIAAALVGVILMQRSEGGGLGMGGSPSGLMSARGAADFLTRSTSGPGDAVRRIQASCSPSSRRRGMRSRSTPRSPASLRHPPAAGWSHRHRHRAPRLPLPSQRPPPPRAMSRPRRATARCRSSADPAPLVFCAPDRIRVLVGDRLSTLGVYSHGAVHFHHRRRGLLAWQGSHGGKSCSPPPGAWLFGPHPQVRSVSERRPGNDVAVPARRSLCDRRRGGDRPRPRPL